VSVRAGQRRIWFLDTASLLSMAVDEAIAAVVLEEIGDDPVMVVDIVTDELLYRATEADTAVLAKTALASKRKSWIDVDTALFVPLHEIRDAQSDVADGRTLATESQHWAESTIIAMGRLAARAGSTSVKLLLSEDYEARRVASGVPHMSGVSIHGLLHAWVHADRMTAARAAELAKMLEDAGRAREVTAEDFADPTGRGLGRYGRPRFRL
jgi:hypothetical protein